MQPLVSDPTSAKIPQKPPLCTARIRYSFPVSQADAIGSIYADRVAAVCNTEKERSIGREPSAKALLGEGIDRDETVDPSDLFTFSVGARIVGDRQLDNAIAALEHLSREFRFDLEP